EAAPAALVAARAAPEVEQVARAAPLISRSIPQCWKRSCAVRARPTPLSLRTSRSRCGSSADSATIRVNLVASSSKSWSSTANACAPPELSVSNQTDVGHLLAEIAPQERGRAALAAIPRLRSSPLDLAECALASLYAVRASFLF